MILSNLMTEKSRLATAAAAIVQRMIILNKLLVFLPVLPWRKGSREEAVMAMTSAGFGKDRCISLRSINCHQLKG
jgi:hypothetical protein